MSFCIFSFKSYFLLMLWIQINILENVIFDFGVHGYSIVCILKGGTYWQSFDLSKMFWVFKVSLFPKDVCLCWLFRKSLRVYDSLIGPLVFSSTKNIVLVIWRLLVTIIFLLYVIVWYSNMCSFSRSIFVDIDILISIYCFIGQPSQMLFRYMYVCTSNI